MGINTPRLPSAFTPLKEGNYSVSVISGRWSVSSFKTPLLWKLFQTSQNVCIR